LVQRITDAEGRELFAHENNLRQAVSPALAYQITSLLKLVVDQGTGRRVRNEGFLAPAAGKTGTTNDNTDAWFTGYTPDLVTSVWVGFDERKEHKLVDVKGRQITGGSGAVPIWVDFMKEATVGERDA
jgi:membrane carboxypeptidase/penicillin-binding protein